MISTIASQAGGSSLDAAAPFIGPAISSVQSTRKAAPHHEATAFVDDFEGPLGAALAEVVRLQQSDPERARALFEDAYGKYLYGIRAYGQLPTTKIIAQQSLGNSKLQSTLQSIAAGLGINLGSVQPKPSPITKGILAGVDPAKLNGGIMANQPWDEKIPGSPNLGGNTGAIATLGKIFGVNTGSGDQSIIDQLIKIGVPLTGAVLTGLNASKAANTQAEAAERAMGLQAQSAANSLDFAKGVYGDQQSQTAPYREAGVSALDKIKELLELGPAPADGSSRPDPTTALTNTPRYKLNFSEGIKALNAANRGVMSGRTIKAAERFGQDLANNAFDSNFRDLSTVAGFGQQGVSQNLGAGDRAVSTNTNVNSNLANTTGELGQQAAAARASGYGQGVGSQVLNEIQKQQLLKQLGF